MKSRDSGGLARPPASSLSFVRRCSLRVSAPADVPTTFHPGKAIVVQTCFFLHAKWPPDCCLGAPK
ncbi:hypothetical protein ACHAXT_008012 [Thalassiosira profunda]